MRYNYARTVDNPEHEPLVVELYKTNAAFRRLWDTYHMHDQQVEICRLRLPQDGDITLRLLYSTVYVHPPLRLVFLASADDASAKALAFLESPNSEHAVASNGASVAAPTPIAGRLFSSSVGFAELPADYSETTS